MPKAALHSTGPEARSNAAAALLTVRIMCALGAVVTGLPTVALGSSPAAVLGWLALMLAGAGLALPRRPITVGLSIAALLTGITATYPADLSTFASLTAATWTFVLCYAGIALMSASWGLVWTALCAVLQCVLISAYPLPLVVGSTVVNMRWLLPMQLVVSSVWFLWIWNAERRRVVQRDSMVTAIEDRTSAAVAEQERVRAWRASLVHAHETVLNDLRYVLDADSIDRAGLARQLGRENATPLQRERANSIRRVISSALKDVDLAVEVAGAPDTHELLPQTAEALRAAVVEELRNAVRHGRATRATVDWTPAQATCAIVITHDGEAAITADGVAGMGRALVVDEGMRRVGGRLVRGPGGVTITVRLADEPGAGPVRSQTGRVVASALASGNVIGSLPFAAAVVAAGGLAGSPGWLVLLVLTGLAAAVTLRRTVVPTWLVVAAGLAACTIAPVQASAGAACSDAESLGRVTALSAFALTAVLAWAPALRLWLLALPSAVTAAWVVLQVPAECREPFAANGTAALVPLIAFVFMTWTLRISEARVQAVRQLDLIRIREDAAARAMSDIGAQLDRAVAVAREQLARIASGAELDHGVRIRLRCLDASIRAALQVDPQTAGGFSVACRSIVESASAAGRPVRVLTIVDSGQSPQVPASLLSTLTAIATGAGDKGVTVQVLRDGQDDSIAITAPATALHGAGIGDGWTEAFTDCVASADVVDEDEALVTVRRRATAAAPAAEVTLA